MEDVVPKTPDLKDMISMDEAATLQGCSFREIEDLIEQGKLSSCVVDGQRLLDRQEVERLKAETDVLQGGIGDDS